MVEKMNANNFVRKKNPIALYVSRTIGALLIIGVLYLVFTTGEWVLLILVLYGIFFLLKGSRFL
jgi:hypothetical protein